MTMPRKSSIVGLLVLAAVLCGGKEVLAQASQLPPPPATKAAIGPWDAALVHRVSELIQSPAEWDRKDTGDCPDKATAYSIQCAFDAVYLEAVAQRGAAHVTAKGARAPLVECELRVVGNHREGTCGPLFDEMPVFTLTQVPAVTSGTWRADMQPSAVWSGAMINPETMTRAVAIRVIAQVTTRTYQDRLQEFNNDPATTFADLQVYFHVLEDALRKLTVADISDQAGDAVEAEVYKGGTGVIRTYAGWYPVSGFEIRDSVMRFRIDTVEEVPPSALDKKILERAATIITSDAVWNRADNRKCPATARTWSIYCAVEQAEVEVAGGFHHRRPAMELVRTIVDERTKTKSYQHRLMDYNNDLTTRLDDVRTLFAEAIKRIKP
jgi:hypothetical protein